MEKIGDAPIKTKVPILKITINKEYYRSSKPIPHQHKHHQAPSSIKDVLPIISVPVQKTNSEIRPNTKIQSPNCFVLPKPTVLNMLPVVSTIPLKGKYTEIESKSDIYIPKTAYTRKGDLSRDNVRNQTSTERLRYLYTKAQRDCDILKMRLKALRERHKHEQDELKRLEIHYGMYFNDTNQKSVIEASTSEPREKRARINLDDTDDEAEYEKLLMEVQNMKKQMMQRKLPPVRSHRRLKATNILLHDRNTARGRGRKINGNKYIPRVHNIKAEEIAGENDKDTNAVREKTNRTTDGDVDLEDCGPVYIKEQYLDPIYLDD